ncbi:hypothetical protein C5S31_00975 [ANME-1 cluster archaeon GoMg2]|nr:hypothetical protein [ANME-1 cluster archaeon GoMg2]
MSEYKLFAQRVGLVGIVNLLVSLNEIILLLMFTKTPSKIIAKAS